MDFLFSSINEDIHDEIENEQLCDDNIIDIEYDDESDRQEKDWF